MPIQIETTLLELVTAMSDLTDDENELPNHLRLV